MGEEEEDTIPSVYIQNMEALSDAAKIASRSIEAYPGVVSAVKQIADCMKQYQGISPVSYTHLADICFGGEIRHGKICIQL